MDDRRAIRRRNRTIALLVGVVIAAALVGTWGWVASVNAEQREREALIETICRRQDAVQDAWRYLASEERQRALAPQPPSRVRQESTARLREFVDAIEESPCAP